MEQFSLIAQVVVLVIQIVIAWYVFVRGRHLSSTYQCDSLYMDITRTMLSDTDLLDFYEIGSPEEIAAWRSKTVREKKLFLLAEMNYFHLAFVHREYLKGHVTAGYWAVYEQWMRKLLQSDGPFREVHKVTGSLFGGESGFSAAVDRAAREAS